MTGEPIDTLVRRCFAAYQTKDRTLIEGLIADDFSFTSPYDDHIDRKTYFERCWPNADKIRSVRIEKFFVQGDEAFVLYAVETTVGARFKNAEFHRFAGGKLAEVEVYFGEVPGRAPTK